MMMSDFTEEDKNEQLKIKSRTLAKRQKNRLLAKSQKKKIYN